MPLLTLLTLLTLPRALPMEAVDLSRKVRNPPKTA
jgi:hypothetical protein